MGAMGFTLLLVAAAAPAAAAAFTAATSATLKVPIGPANMLLLPLTLPSWATLEAAVAAGPPWPATGLPRPNGATTPLLRPPAEVTTADVAPPSAFLGEDCPIAAAFAKFCAPGDTVDDLPKVVLLFCAAGRDLEELSDLLLITPFEEPPPELRPGCCWAR